MKNRRIYSYGAFKSCMGFHKKDCPFSCFKDENIIFDYVSVIKSRRMRWAGHAARMGEKRNAYRILVGKPE
jgi:hypothetical protein